MPKKFRPKDDRHEGRSSSGALNWTMCLLCVTSLGVSGMLAYRELRLEERIAGLELMCQANMQQRIEPSDVIVKRVQREVKEQIEDVKKTLVGPDSTAGIFRIKRDVDCNCPPG